MDNQIDIQEFLTSVELALKDIYRAIHKKIRLSAISKEEIPYLISWIFREAQRYFSEYTESNCCDLIIKQGAEWLEFDVKVYNEWTAIIYGDPVLLYISHHNILEEHEDFENLFIFSIFDRFSGLSESGIEGCVYHQIKDIGKWKVVTEPKVKQIIDALETIFLKIIND